MRTSMKYATLVALALAVTAGIVSAYLSPTLAQGDTRARDKVERLIHMANRTRERVEGLFANATGQGIEIPQNATDAKNAGDQALTEAQNSFAAGNYTATAGSAVQALHSYHLAARIVLSLLGEEPQPPPAGRGLRIAISRANRTADRLADALDQLEHLGANATIIAGARDKIADARALLVQGLENLQNGDVNATAHNLGEAHGLLSSAMRDIVHLGKNRGAERLTQYIRQARMRIEVVQRMIDRARGDPKANQTAVQEAQNHLDLARVAVGEAEDLGRQGLIQEAYAKLRVADTEIRAATQALRHIR